MPDTLNEARQAFRRHDWEMALSVLSDADHDQQLSADDLTMLGDSLWWAGRPEDAAAALERAFAGFVEEGRSSEAARAGSLLAYFAMRRQAPSVAKGWIARVEQLLDGEEESNGHAWLAILRVARSLFLERDHPSAIRLADEAIEVARRVGAPGLESMATSFKGISMIHEGDWRSGMALIDQAAAFAISQGDDLRAISDVYCNTIAACAHLGDYRKAGEWTDEAERWMKTQSVGGYTGVCQVHRAELKRVRGSWPEAEQEARRACLELERFHIVDGIGFANYEIGETRRRMGDLQAAEEAFEKAYEYGHWAQPGLSLLMLDKGNVEEAGRAIAGALARIGPDEDPRTPSPTRGRLLAAQVEIALAAGDTATAHRATEELEEIADFYDSQVWDASALACRGALDLHEGKVDEAIETLDRSWRLCLALDMPYEGARTRALLGGARLAAGDDTAARLEFRAARSAFQQLGAAADLRALDALAGDDGGVRADLSLSKVNKTLMFTDIVTSTDLIGLIGDDAWQELLGWHDRALRAEFAAASGEEVSHTGDGFFVVFDNTRDGIDCAVAIQRRLSDHRHQSGFAPQVRIGLHRAEVAQRLGNYTGQGVHLAARVGAAAGGQEILVTKEVLDGTGQLPFPVSAPRLATLKGIDGSVQVFSVDWQT